MNFIHRHGLMQPVRGRPPLEPCRIVPFVLIQPRHHRARARRMLGSERVRVRLHFGVAAELGPHVVFVDRALAQIGQEQFPRAAVAQPHRMAPRVPAVEIAHHRDHQRVGRPHGKPRARHALGFGEVRAERRVALVVRAFAVQVQLERREDRRERIRIVLHARIGAHPQAETVARRALGERRHPEPVRVRFLHRHHGGLAFHHHIHRGGLRKKRADFPAATGVRFMNAEHGKRIAVVAARDCVKVRAGGGNGGSGTHGWLGTLSMVAICQPQSPGNSSSSFPRRSCISIWKAR